VNVWLRTTKGVEQLFLAAPTYKLISRPVRRRVSAMKWIASFVFIAVAAFGFLGTQSTAFSQALPVVNDTAIPLMVPNAGQILMSFPICSFSSSLGQNCKLYSETEKTSVRLYTDKIIKKIELNADNASIETDDWDYSMHSVKENDLGFTFNFTDDSKFASYLTDKKFYAERDKGSLGW
jgi:hypothetical protein